MKKSVIIVAGGSGSRMHAMMPKQFLLLQGKPMLLHSMERFSFTCRGIDLIVVLPEQHFKTWESLCEQYHVDLPHRVAPGGVTRFDSVKNGLDLIVDEGLVAVHDAARPLVSESLIRAAFDCAIKLGNGVPAIPVQESMRKMEHDLSSPVDRNLYRLIQTPQIFTSGSLKSAYRQPYREQFTDDATVVECLGEKINLIPGDYNNIKITNREDMEIAGFLMGRSR